MLKILIFIITLIIFVVGGARFIERTAIYFPIREIEGTPEIIGLPYQDVFIESANLQIHGWFVPYKNARYTLLFFHGNGGNISHRLDKISLLHSLGLNILIVSYRGYGKSQGRPTEDGLYQDGESSYDFLIDRFSSPADKIILYGESLGAQVAIDLASKKNVGALILEGSFSSARDVARKVYPFIPGVFFSDKFNSTDKINKVKEPILFLHSAGDEIVPIKLARKLYNKADTRKEFSELRGGHNSAYRDSKDKYLSSIKSFIDSLKGK
jgi:uncharacterized protein